MTLLKSNDIAFLNKHFRFMSEISSEPVEIIHGSKLKTEEDLEDFLINLGSYIQAENKIAAASFFTKRYAYLVVTSAFVLMSAFTKAPKIDLNNILFNRFEDDKAWLPKLDLIDREVSIPVEGIDRSDWMRERCEELFKGHLQPLFERINRVSNLPLTIMWENFAVYLFWLYEREAENLFETSVLATMSDDFHNIIHVFGGEVFGTEENPLRGHFYQKKLPNGARQRKTCCLAFQVGEKKNYCTVCPHHC